MNIGLNLVGTLLFLSPGFVPILIEHFRSGTVIRRPTLSSGSILVLGLVPAFACVAHLVGMLVYSWNSSIPVLIRWPEDPNPYPSLLNVLSESSATSSEGAKILLGLSMINFLAFAIYFFFRELVVRIRRNLMERKFGWEAVWPGETMVDALFRIQATDPHRALLATVETDGQASSRRSGWVGPVENVRLDNSEAIVSVALQIPSVFSESDDLDGLFGSDHNYHERQPNPPYMVVVIPASEIKSIRFSLSKGVETESENPNADVLVQSESDDS